MFAMPQPEVYLSNSNKLFDAGGNLTNQSARALLEAMLQKFETWIRPKSRRARAEGYGNRLQLR
jgi:hypothetical protein